MRRSTVLAVALCAALALLFAALAAPALAQMDVEDASADELAASAGRAAAQLQALEKEAEQAGDDEEPEAYLVAHPAVTTASLFPKHRAGDLPLGERVDVICSFRNSADVPLNVTAIRGSLHMSYDFRYVVQNFTRYSFGRTVVPPKSEVSLSYPFFVDPLLEARDYHLSFVIYYQDLDGRHEYMSYFYNATAEFVEAGTDASLILFTVVSAAVVAAGIGYFAYRAFGTLRTGSSARTTKGTADLIAEKAKGSDFLTAADRALLQGSRPRSKTPTKTT